MSTKEEIDEEFLRKHKNLTQRFRQRHEITKEEFDKLHGQLWRDHSIKLAKVLGGRYHRFWHAPFRDRWIKALKDHFIERTITKEQLDKNIDAVLAEGVPYLINVGLLMPENETEFKAVYYEHYQDIYRLWKDYFQGTIERERWSNLCKASMNDFLKKIDAVR